jgi:ribosomal protein L11 methylase PrmA
LVTLAPQLIQCMADEGLIVLSGIMTAQQEQVEAAYEGEVMFVDQFEQDGWVCLVGRRC